MLTAQQFFAPRTDKGTAQWLDILMATTEDNLPEKIALMKQASNTAADISFLSLANFLNDETKCYFEQQPKAIFTIEQLINRVSETLSENQTDLASLSKAKHILRRLHAGLYNFIQSVISEKLTSSAEEEFRKLLQTKLLTDWKDSKLPPQLVTIIHDEIAKIYKSSLKKWQSRPLDQENETDIEFSYWQTKVSKTIKNKILYGDKTITAEKDRLTVEALILKLQVNIEFFGEQSAALQEDIISAVTTDYQEMKLPVDFSKLIDKKVNQFIKAYPEDKDAPHIEAFQKSAIEALFIEWRTHAQQNEFWSTWLKGLSPNLENAMPKEKREAFEQEIIKAIIDNFKAGKYGEDVRYLTIEAIIRSLPDPEKQKVKIHTDMDGLLVNTLLENIISRYRPATDEVTCIEVHQALLELSLQPLREQLTSLANELEKYGVTVSSEFNAALASTHSLRV